MRVYSILMIIEDQHISVYFLSCCSMICKGFLPCKKCFHSSSWCCKQRYDPVSSLPARMSSIGSPSSTPILAHLVSYTQNSSSHWLAHRSHCSKYTWEGLAFHHNKTCQWFPGAEIFRSYLDSHPSDWQPTWRRRGAEDIHRDLLSSNPAYLNGILWYAWLLSLCLAFRNSRNSRFYGSKSTLFYNVFTLPLICTSNDTKCISIKTYLFRYGRDWRWAWRALLYRMDTFYRCSSL